MRLTGLSSAALIGALASVVGAEAYRFIFDDSEAADTDIVSSEGAARWRESRFPLTFRMLDNDYLPSEIGIDEGRWAAIVERSLERWTDIPTSSVQPRPGRPSRQGAPGARRGRDQYRRLYLGLVRAGLVADSLFQLEVPRGSTYAV